MKGEPMTDVLIAGAGPAGFMLAAGPPDPAHAIG
jgi:hypothetical protein